MSSNPSTLPTTGEAPQPNFFQQMYINTKQTGKKVPWDVGYSQPALAAVSASFQGRVLDVGCGTGDNSIFVGSLPGVSSVTAVDFSKEAISMCKERLANASPPPKAPVTFLEADVFDLPGDLCEFDTLIDSAVFHCIGDDEQQRKYLAAVTPRVKVGGTVVMFVFSDMNKDPWKGPRRISEAHARKLWTDAGWTVESLSLDHVYAHDVGGGPRRDHALLMVAKRTA